jgi:hypothetical protein
VIPPLNGSLCLFNIDVFLYQIDLLCNTQYSIWLPLYNETKQLTLYIVSRINDPLAPYGPKLKIKFDGLAKSRTPLIREEQIDTF